MTLQLPAFVVERLRDIITAAAAGAMTFEQARFAEQWFRFAVNAAASTEQQDAKPS